MPRGAGAFYITLYSTRELWGINYGGGIGIDESVDHVPQDSLSFEVRGRETTVRDRSQQKNYMKKVKKLQAL